MSMRNYRSRLQLKLLPPQAHPWQRVGLVAAGNRLKQGEDFIPRSAIMSGMCGTALPQHRFRPKPACLVLGLLAVDGLLLLSDRFQLFAFNEKPGLTVLIALASLAVGMLLMLLWLIVSLLRRWRFQFNLRLLFVLVLAWAIPCSWLTVEMRRANVQREAVEPIEMVGGVVHDNLPLGGPCSSLGSSRQRTSTWPTNLFGKHFFFSVRTVDFAPFGDPMWSAWRKSTATADGIDAALARLSQLKHLQALSVSHRPFTDAGLAHIKGLTQLKMLLLSNTKTTDAGVAHLKGLIQLQYLELDDTVITDAGLAHLRGMAQLECLRLENTLVTDAGLPHLKEMVQLRALDLAGTDLTDAGLVCLEGLTKLEWLQLNRTKVTDAGLAHLQGLARLKELWLGPLVSEAGVRQIRQALPDCRIKRERP
jgi:hypothetical protein